PPPAARRALPGGPRGGRAAPDRRPRRERPHRLREPGRHPLRLHRLRPPPARSRRRHSRLDGAFGAHPRRQLRRVVVLLELRGEGERRARGAATCIAMPLVSICIPTYNSARYLPEAIESVLAQEFADYELVVCDNASTDATPEICRRYRDPR